MLMATGLLDRSFILCQEPIAATNQRADPSAGIATIMHGEWLVLVDAQGFIRGYYAASDPERMTGLVHDVLDLAGGPS